MDRHVCVRSAERLRHRTALRRARRGLVAAGTSMTLSKRQRAVLELLELDDMFGLDFVKAGVLSRSSCYIYLAGLENLDLIVGHEVPPQFNEILSRRVYSITERGRAALAANPVVPIAHVVETPLWRRILAWWRR